MESTLTNYATKASVDAVNTKVDNCATTEDIATLATKDSVNLKADKTELKTKADKSDLEGLATEDYVDSKMISQQQMADIIERFTNAVEHISGQVVFEVHPSLNDIQNPNEHTIYLVGPSGSGADQYKEYIYSKEVFVLIGDTSIDLSPYATTESVEAKTNTLTDSINTNTNNISNLTKELEDTNSNLSTVADDLQTLNDLVYSLHYTPAFSVSPATVFAGGSGTTVKATATLKFNGVDVKLSEGFNATIPSGWNQGTNTTTAYKFTKSVNATTSPETTISKTPYSVVKSAKVTAVYPIYYGQTSSTDTKVLTGLTQVTSALTTAVNRTYTVNMTAGNYFIVAVPSGVTNPTQVGTGGSDGFFADLVKIGTATVTEPRSSASVSYTFYRTSSKQSAGSTGYYLK